jgi:DNA modification methylase
MRETSGQAYVCEGNSAQMTLIGDGEADLVYTSPPYFSDETEQHLRVPLRQQRDYEKVSREITEFAMSLRPVFVEIARVLKPEGFLVLQTKHIRYGPWLIPLTDLHCDLALNSNLRLVTKLEWLPVKTKPERRPVFIKDTRRGLFKSFDTESFLVFCNGDVPDPGDTLVNMDETSDQLAEPLWKTAVAAGKRHPYASPPKVVRRFIQMYSRPGELVVDPFCGFGTTLVEAEKLGRRSIGYEINHEYVIESRARLK